MFDFGWMEILVVAAVAVFVFGPEDIPKLMHGLGRIFRRIHYMKYTFSQQFEEFIEAQDAQFEGGDKKPEAQIKPAKVDSNGEPHDG